MADPPHQRAFAKAFGHVGLVNAAALERAERAE
jgi:hypothetical protein